MANTQMNVLVSELVNQLTASQENQQLSSFIGLNNYDNSASYPQVVVSQHGQQAGSSSAHTLYQEQHEQHQQMLTAPEEENDNQSQQQTQEECQEQSEDHFRAYLIEEVRKYPCVWDTKSRGFKNSVMKRNVWLKIGVELNVKDTEAEAEFKRLKENYRKCLKKREAESRSGAEGKKLPTCAFFNELEFLRDSVTNRKTASNVYVSSPAHHQQLSSPDPLSQSPTTVFQSSSSFLSPPTSRRSSVEVNVEDQSSPTFSSTDISHKARKQKPKEQDQLNDALTAALVKDLNREQVKNNVVVEDSDTLFCKSLIGPLKKLSSKKNKRARVKLLQTLLEFESSDED